MLDYKKLGFKCGIEIHQQLAGRKLFCECPTEIRRKTKPDFTITRRLRALAGETGRVDQAAKHEQSKELYYEYQGFYDLVCCVELDEEPPHPINQEALYAALQVCKLLNAEIVDELHVMRKTVTDGSNVSGFQRTVLVGRNGHIEVDGKKIGIAGIFLEEEAAPAEEKHKDRVVYNLSRLGIPLLEIATDPDISSPEECKKVAEHIGMVLRSTGKCMRGIGTIRQDVNLSIKGSARVEIKGFQDLRSIPKVINNELERQLKNLKGKKNEKSHVRKAEADFSTTFMRPMPGASRMYPETDIPRIVPDKKNIEIPKLLSEEVEDIKKLGLSNDLAKKLTKSGKLELFSAFSKKFKNVKAAFIAEILVSYIPELLRNYKGLDPLKIKDEHLEKTFSGLDKGQISKDSIMKLLVDVAGGKRLDLSKYELANDADVEKDIQAIIDKNPNAPIGALMGMIMGKFKGSVDGKKAMEILRKYKK